MPIGRFAPHQLPKYPHLTGLDKLIWDRYMLKNDLGFTSFDYDVHVGDGEIAPNNLEPPMKKMWSSVTQKRIDVVAYKSDTATIIEIKSFPTCGVIGQILAYKELYIKSYAPSWGVELLMIANVCSRDIIYCLNQFNIPHILIQI